MKRVLFVCIMILTSQIFSNTDSTQTRASYFKLFHFSMTLEGMPTFNRIIQIDHVGELVRDIPRHPGDGWLRGYPAANRPLDDALYQSEYVSEGDMAVYLSFITVAEFGLYFQSYDDLHTNIPFRVQQNQYGGTGRQYGTSLRWYEIEYDDTESGIFVHGVFRVHTPMIPLPITEGFGLFLQPFYSWHIPFSSVSYKVRNGYDRYGKDELYLELGSVEIKEYQQGYGIKIGLYQRTETFISLYVLLLKSQHRYTATRTDVLSITFPNPQTYDFVGFGLNLSAF